MGVAVKLFGTAMRARTERGGWVSIKATGGKTLFERKGDFDVKALEGQYRIVASAAPVFGSPDTNAQKVRDMKVGTEFSANKVSLGSGNAIFGYVDNAWVLIHSAE